MGTEAATLAWVDRRGQTLGTIGERANYQGIALSHEETRVAAVIGEPTSSSSISRTVCARPSRLILRDIPTPSGLPTISSSTSGPHRKPRCHPWIASRRMAAGAIEQIFPDEKVPMLPFD